MNREIKFRVWDIVDNKWFKPNIGTTEGLFLTMGLNGDLILNSNKAHEGNYLSRFIINQYTGFKDKDGIYIYEGDIIGTIGKRFEWGNTITPEMINPVLTKRIYTNKCNRPSKVGKKMDVIFYDYVEIKGEVEYTRKGYSPIITYTADYNGNESCNELLTETRVVIGNIYENPDLLKNNDN